MLALVVLPGILGDISNMSLSVLVKKDKSKRWGNKTFLNVSSSIVSIDRFLWLYLYIFIKIYGQAKNPSLLFSCLACFSLQMMRSIVTSTESLPCGGVVIADVSIDRRLRCNNLMVYFSISYTYMYLKHLVRRLLLSTIYSSSLLSILEKSAGDLFPFRLNLIFYLSQTFEMDQCLF